MKYELSHLNQPLNQDVAGPIQDDEALLFYALCKTMLIKHVVEIGTYQGYSVENFSKCLPEDGEIIGFDVSNHGINVKNFKFIHKSAGDVEPSDIPWEIDLVFFDSHDFNAQVKFYEKMILSKKITSETILAVHDTNLHPKRPEGNPYGIVTEKGWIHQPEERRFINWLVDQGWYAFHFHTKMERHTDNLPYRHGLSILSKKNKLDIC